MIVSYLKENLIKPIVKTYLKKRYFSLDRFSHPSFSQMGEDMILRKIFDQQAIGFYVDVGAYHPKQHSNTYYFYINGWRGINIDAMPGSMIEFKKYRPKDINLEKAISNSNKKVSYYIFDQLALNTLSYKVALKREKETNYRIIRKKTLKTEKLETVLKKYMPRNQKVDILNIDAEGIDYSILMSNNWEAFRPKVIVVEDANFLLEEPTKSRIFNFLKKKNYSFLAKTDVSLIFKDNFI